MVSNHELQVCIHAVHDKRLCDIWNVQDPSRINANQRAYQDEQYAPGYGDSWEFLDNQEHKWIHQAHLEIR